MDCIAVDAIAGHIHPLSHLRTLNIACLDGQVRYPIQTLAPFFALPSLKKLRGCHLEADLTPFDWGYGAHRSNLEELELTESAIEALQLAEILEFMGHLRTFRCSHSSWNNEGGLDWDAAQSLRNLMNWVGPTLEELSITSEDRSILALGSFVRFTRLQKSELSVNLLYRDNSFFEESMESGLESFHTDAGDLSTAEMPDPASSRRIIDILPASLEELILLWDTREPQSKNLFESFAEV